jgi:TRAP transporter TAXI family solute receptor
MSRWLAPWLNGLTALELALVFCAFYIVITLLGVFLVQPLMRRTVHGTRPVNDIVIFVAANFGVVYAVLLGLLIVATFQNTKDLQDHIATEASRLSTIYRGAESYPEPLRSELRSQLRDYTHYIIEKDWPAHRKGRVLVGGDHRLQAIRQALFSYELTPKPEEALHGAMLRYFNDMTVSREQRLSAVSSSIPDVLWYVVIIGSIFTIVFLWMIHMDLIPHIILGGSTAFFLGLTTFLIYAMDHPLQSAVSVGPEPFQAAYDSAMKWDEGYSGETMASLGTGEVELVYNKVGRAICEVVNQDIRELGVRCSAENTPGSQYNVDAIHSGELEFGIVQSDIAYTAYNGKGTFANRPFGDLRSVAVLYPEIVTLMARSDSGIAQIADLAGRRINVGRQGSGTHAIWDDLQATLGWKDAQITEWPAEEASRALCAGKIDANFLQVGHPSAAVREQLAACPTRFVAVNGTAVDALLALAPYFVKRNIPGQLYGLTADIPSFGSNAVLMTSARVDAKAVAAFARGMIARIDELGTKHPVLASLSIGEMTGNDIPAPAPFHPAANQIYKALAN